MARRLGFGKVLGFLKRTRHRPDEAGLPRGDPYREDVVTVRAAQLAQGYGVGDHGPQSDGCGSSSTWVQAPCCGLTKTPALFESCPDWWPDGQPHVGRVASGHAPTDQGAGAAHRGARAAARRAQADRLARGCATADLAADRPDRG